MNRELKKIILTAVLLLTLVACGAPKTDAGKFAQIKIGMSQKQVSKLLGPPAGSGHMKSTPGLQGDVRVCTYVHENKMITVTFINDRVTEKNQTELP